MSISPWIVIAITFEEVDRAPDAKSGSESDNEGLENIYRAVEKIHEIVAGRTEKKLPQATALRASGAPFKNNELIFESGRFVWYI